MWLFNVILNIISWLRNTLLNPIIFGAVVTIIGGLILFIYKKLITFIYKKFFFEPLNYQKECIKNIAYYISLYANLWDNPGYGYESERDKASKKFRELAIKLSETKGDINIKLYPIFVRLNLSRSYKDIDKAHDNLIRLSHSLGLETYESSTEKSKQNSQIVYNIEKSLKLETCLGMNMEHLTSSMLSD